MRIAFALLLWLSILSQAFAFSHGNSQVPYVGNSGASGPIYSGNVDPHGIYVPSTNTTWLAWEGYNGVYRTEQVTTFNHSTLTWSPITTAIISGSIDNDHPNPAICRDAGGYEHVFSGHHPFPLNHAVTTNPDDPSSWVQQPSPSGTGSTSPVAYPHCYLIGSTLYLFLQGSTWSQLVLYTSSSVVNGVVTWNAPIIIGDFGGGTGNTGNRFYQGNAVVVGTKINFVFCFSNPTDTFSRGLYFMSYDTTTGSVTNLQGTVTTPAASFPVLKTTMDASYMVADNSGNTTLTNSVALGYDGSGNTLMVMQDKPASTYLLQAYRYSGGTLTGPTQIDTSQSVFSYSFVPLPNGSVDLYYAKSGKFGSMFAADGDIWKVNVSSSGVWGSSSLVQSSGNFYPLGEPVAIVAPNANARVYWSEANQNAFAPTGTLKFDLYGDNGFVQRPVTGLPSPQPFVSYPPAASWNPADMTAAMNLVGNNLLANPGPNNTDYPSPSPTPFSQVRSVTSHSSGKYHVEFLVQQSQVPSAATNGFGVCSASHVYGTPIGADTTSAGLWGDAFYSNNVANPTTPDLQNWQQGHWFAMEVDLGALQVSYKDITAGGSYHAFSLSGLTGSPWFLCTEIGQYQDGIALNTGEFPYLSTPTSGFGSW